MFLYSLAGIAALNLVRIFMNRLILYKFDIEKEVVEGQNVGSGAAEFGMYVATGLLSPERSLEKAVMSHWQRRTREKRPRSRRFGSASDTVRRNA